MWKQIKQFPLYEVNEYGEVRRNERLLSKRANNKGRLQYRLYDGAGKSRYVQAHILVIETFVEERPEGKECRHLDGNHLNNHVSNLSWGTRSENAYDRVRHGRNNGRRGNS